MSERSMTPIAVNPAEAGANGHRFVAEFERLTSQSGAQPSWVRELRGRALARFGELGIPTTREEEWRFTTVAPIGDVTFRLGAPADAAARALVDSVAIPDAQRLVVVNGRFSPALSSDDRQDGVETSSLADALARSGDGRALQGALGRAVPFDTRAFVALNTAFLHDGVFIHVAKGAIVERPVQLVFVSVPGAEATMSHPRIFAMVGDGAQVRLVETYVGMAGAPYLTNTVAEFEIGENAVVDHYRDQREAANGFHIGLQAAHCARSSTFLSHAFTLGGQIVRNDTIAVLDGEGIDCTLNGLYLADRQRLVDNHTLIDHAQPHCGSHELYKGILAGRAKAVFNGKIIVRPDAQKTDAKQTNRALLLSDEAQINTKPQLEIFADDVKCTHGAAIGQLDEEALFYLRARGLTARQARDMMIHAFAGDILGRVKIDALRDQLEGELFLQLQADGVM